MKKFQLIVMALVVAICMSGCVITIVPDFGLDETEQTLTFVEAKFYEYFYDEECVALFFDYANNSDEDKCAADGFIMVGKQKGKVLGTMWVAEEVDGAITPSTNVPAHTTARVAWLFVLRDKSTISIEITDGQEFTIDYEQIGKIEK